MPNRIVQYNGEYRIDLARNFSCSIALRQAPKEMELELKTGVWIVLLIAVWSAVDLYAIDVAEQAVNKFEGRVCLGVRPFDSHEEIQKWCPNCRENNGSPIWLIIKDGRMIAETVGLLSEEQVRDFIEFHIRIP